MRIESYRNFDELFYQFNRKVLLNPSECIDSVRQTMGYIDNLVFKCSSYDCTLNIGDFGFKKAKFYKSVSQLINKDDYVQFKKELSGNSKNCILSFNQKPGTMIGLVMKRVDTRYKFNCCTVFFKNADVQKDFAVNLVLLNRIFTDIKEYCDVKEIVLIISQATLSAQYINGYLDFFDLGYEELDQEHPFIKTMIGIKNNYFSDKTKLSTYNSLRRMQEMYFDLIELPVVPVNELRLFDND